MQKVIISAIIILISTAVYTQQISVASFERLDNDLTARVDHPVRDQNGDVSALIKIETTQTGFRFEGCGLGIVKTKEKIGEIWVYVPFGARRLSIHHPDLGTLRNYPFPIPIEEATTYVMQLTTARVTTVIEEPENQTEWLVIQSEPDGAQVFINDRPVGRTPFSGEFNIGRHNYRVELPMYHSQAGTFTLSADAGRHDIDLSLRPAFGSIRITSEPESKAEVLLNGEPTGQITPCTLENIRSGTHTITIKKDMYYDAWEEVTVEDNKTTQVNLKMRPAYGVIKITTNPEADIYINAQKEGHGSHIVRKLTGFYNIEAKKDKHTPASRRIEVKDGAEITVSLNPTPKHGQLRIATTPPDAEIFLDGKKIGITPVTLREVLIGDYYLELRKTGYASYTQNISIKHNETTDINETLPDGIEITITSEPSGANIEIDGKSKGVTPFVDMLGFGSYNIKLKNNTKVVNERISITQGGKAKWDFDVREGIEILITSTPSGSKLEINGQSKGTTPFRGTLNFGSHYVKLTNNEKIVNERINVTQGGKEKWAFDVREDKESATDWNLGVLPVVSYNSDLGLQYGGLINLYDYGDGKSFPKYHHSIYAEISRFTRGSGIYRTFYDSEFLIPGIRITADIVYLPDQAVDFFGFNGYNAVFNKNWIDENSEHYKSRLFYNHERNIFRIKIDLQGKLPVDNLNWVLGYNFMDIKTGSVPVDVLNEGRDDEDKLPDIPGLYDKYIEWGIINSDEKSGGMHNSGKIGMVYDTRDNEPCPMSGVWSEIVLFNSFSENFTFGKIALTHRQYFTLIPKNLSFVYRLSYQTIVYGKQPFYLYPYMIYSYMPSSTVDGLGGNRTVRGMLRNRTVGKGMMYGNIELRYKFARFRFLRQNWYVAISPFTDFGMVLENYNIDKSKVPDDLHSDYFKNNAERPHITFGSGIRFAMNENFVLGADVGIPIDSRDGNLGIYVGMNWLF